MNTPEKIADEIVSEVQLIDNTSDDAAREGRELRAYIAIAIREARLAGARAALKWAHAELYRWDWVMAARHILTADPAAVLADAPEEVGP